MPVDSQRVQWWAVGADMLLGRLVGRAPLSCWVRLGWVFLLLLMTDGIYAV
jgi:hypothetical protein